MNLKQYAWVAVGAAFVVSASAAKLGDPAGKLVIKDWVKGTPVDVTDGKNIYVVEFWATWCGPCRVTIPQLSAMQSKFKDKGVVFVGISDEPAATVKPFVDTMGEQMAYAVACDTDRQSNAKYTEAYGQAGIPVAFIVGKDKRVLWFGHPMAELTSTLEQIIAGTYDLPAAIKRDEARLAMVEYDRLSMMGDPKAPELGLKALNMLPNQADAYLQFAFGIVGNHQNRNRDFRLATQALDRAEKLSVTKDFRIDYLRSICLFDSGKREEGLAAARRSLQTCTDPQQRPALQNVVQQMEAILTRMKAAAGNRSFPAPAPGSAPASAPAPK